MKKTFKIGEYVVGGIIEVISNKEKITINFKDYFSKELILSKIFNIDNNNVLNNIDTFISENGTSYYADKITQYIKDNIKLPEPKGWYGW